MVLIVYYLQKQTSGISCTSYIHGLYPHYISIVPNVQMDCTLDTIWLYLRLTFVVPRVIKVVHKV